MALWDRVTGAVAATVPPDAPPGRHVADGAGDVLFGATRAAAGDQLVADAERGWSATLRSGHAAGRFAAAELVDHVTQAALDVLAERLLDEHGAIAWATVHDVGPFERPRPERLEPTRVDRALTSCGPHLLEVVRAPHAHLDAIVEPVLASRARRIPPRALEHLAEHSGDWQQRTLRGIVPRRILSQHPDEQLDVYENRLVARTIDRLLAYLRRREAELAVCAEQLEAGDAGDLDERRKAGDAGDLDERRKAGESYDLGGPHWLARRLASLWGTTFASAEQRERVAWLRRQAEVRRRRVGGLKDSPLYAAVPRHAAVGGELRRTNVLVNHQHYQRVVALWRVLEQEAPEVATRDRYAAEQAARRAFDAFALLLVMRSLDGFGYRPRAGR
jgi:Domain of unknown function (DUF2357)